MWLRTKNSEKDEKAISSANLAKTKNVKPGIYDNKVLKSIPGYTFSNNQLLRVEIAFDGAVTVWSCDQVAYGCGLSYREMISLMLSHFLGCVELIAVMPTGHRT